MEDQKVKSNIPNDLALNILSKLPVKSLKRFGCVQKSWANLLDDPHFMSMYFENLISKNKNGDSSLLLRQQVSCTQEQNLFLLSGDKYENKVTLDWPGPFQEDSGGISIFGSCVNGMICVFELLYNDVRAVLWNPTTEDVKVIPSGVIHVPGFDYVVCFHGFGHDQVRDDYKLLQYVCCFEDIYLNCGDERRVPEEPFWQIYSLKNNCWKKLSLEMTIKLLTNNIVSMYLNGVLHWLGIEEYNHQPEVEEILVSFDLSSETFCVTSICRHDYYKFLSRDLMVLNGCVALLSEVSETKCFHISILGKVGVKESWVKIFTIGPLPFVECPIGVGNKGDIFFRQKDDEIVRFDLSTRVIEEIGIKAVTCQTLIYM